MTPKKFDGWYKDGRAEWGCGTNQWLNIRMQFKLIKIE
jgi:hypothetical protein